MMDYKVMDAKYGSDKNFQKVINKINLYCMV